MNWKKRLLADYRLYLILDAQVNDPNELPSLAQEVSRMGVGPVQLRYKLGNAREVLSIANKIRSVLPADYPFVINDRADIAQICGAAGVHVGQDDLPVPEVRRLMGEDAIIGASCQTLEQAREAVAQGADYLGFGSVFKTLTKPRRSEMDLELLREVVKEVPIPVYAIGGIDKRNVTQLVSLGVSHIAVCRAISCARDVKKASKDLLELLHSSAEAMPA